MPGSSSSGSAAPAMYPVLGGSQSQDASGKTVQQMSPVQGTTNVNGMTYTPDGKGGFTVADSAGKNLGNATQVGGTTTLASGSPSPIQTTTAQRAVTQKNVSDFTSLQANVAGANNTQTPDSNNTDTSTTGGNTTSGGTVINVNGAGTNTQTGGGNGTGTGTGGAGGTNADGTPTDPNATTDPNASDDPNNPYSDSNVKAKVDSLVSDAETNIQNITSTLNATKATTDSSTAALIAQITAMYSERIAGVKDAFTRLGAAQQTAALRNGESQYTPNQINGILSDTEINENMKIGTLQATMAGLISKATAAQGTGDTKAFNTAMTQIQKVQTDTNTAVNNLYKAAMTYKNDQLKQYAQKQKDAQTTLTNANNLSKRAAPGLVAELNGFKTDAEKADFINTFAKKNGIDPNVLWGDVTTAMGTAQKAKLNAQNIQSEIDKRNQPSGGGKTKTYKDGSLSYTQQDSDDIIKSFKAREGADGKTDTAVYNEAYKRWTQNGGTTKGFIKNFDPKVWANLTDPSLNPALLPATSSSGAGSSNPSNIPAV